MRKPVGIEIAVQDQAAWDAAVARFRHRRRDDRATLKRAAAIGGGLAEPIRDLGGELSSFSIVLGSDE